jgi:hypothetical protein
MSNVSLFNPSQVPAFARNAELSATTLALAGGAGPSGIKRVSIKGGVFRLMSAGKEVAAIDERFLDVIIVKAAPKVSRVFYAGSYDKDAAASAPDCTSADGEKPDAGVKNKQASSCAQCPQNISGSGTGQSRACRYQQRLAVVLANNPEGDVLQVTLPATSIFGKEDGGKRPLQAYARYMAAQTPPVNLDTIVTRMKFDTKAESPKLVFEAARWLTDDEYTAAQEQATSDDAAKAVSATPAALDGAAVAPLAIEGKRPAPKPAVEIDEEEAEVLATATNPSKKAKAKPEPVVEEDTAEEPEVRKAAAAKPTAVPAKKSKLADIVSDWDDE